MRLVRSDQISGTSGTLHPAIARTEKSAAARRSILLMFTPWWLGNLSVILQRGDPDFPFAVGFHGQNGRLGAGCRRIVWDLVVKGD